MQGETVKF